jgi:hypothetical protein
VGALVDGTEHIVRATQCHKVSSSCGFHC